MHLTLLFKLRNLIFTESISGHQLLKEHLPYGPLSPVVLHPHESVKGPLPYLPLPLIIFDLLYIVELEAVATRGEPHNLVLSPLVLGVFQSRVFRVSQLTLGCRANRIGTF
jgi:hypothetical protein